jgi:hypothetical protein
MINNYKDLKKVIQEKGGDFTFLLFVVINLIVYNFRVNIDLILLQVIFSILLFFSYVITFALIANFIDKQFSDIKKIGGTDEVWKHPNNFFEKTKSEIIEEKKFRLINYGVTGLFVIDLVAIIFYRNSVIIEFFALLIKYVFGQAENV